MSIPEAQLSTWSNQGAITTSSAAYTSIRHALLKFTSPLADKGVDIYLQGSYANSTNIYGDSDVDVVVLYGDTFYKDMSALTPAQRIRHEAKFPPATYLWPRLRDDVLAALRAHYGNGGVRLGTKSIKVETGSGRRLSDVVPAVQFRLYTDFSNEDNPWAHWGIQFFDNANNAIVNYPKAHIEKGRAKNEEARTAGRYKMTVRLFKNFRNYLIDKTLLADKIAPSYSIECALYNVPDRLFIGDFTTTVPAIIHYLLNTPHAGLICQNGIIPLIGDGPTQWRAMNFATFLEAAQAAWNNWR
jgi:hypothetical protein